MERGRLSRQRVRVARSTTLALFRAPCTPRCWRLAGRLLADGRAGEQTRRRDPDAPPQSGRGQGEGGDSDLAGRWAAAHRYLRSRSRTRGATSPGRCAGPVRRTSRGCGSGNYLPELAKLADKYSLIRTVTHGDNGHETASYLTQTGRNPGRLVFPAVGAVVTAFKGLPATNSAGDGDAAKEGNAKDGSARDESRAKENLIPPYVVLTQPQGRFSEAGFLGIRYKPFATGGDPNAGRFTVEGIVSPDLSDDRQRERRELLQRVNALHRALPGEASLAVAAKSREHAYDLMLGDAGQVFNLNVEKDELRQRYGRTRFGQSLSGRSSPRRAGGEVHHH
jgi:hypothetical protein